MSIYAAYRQRPLNFIELGTDVSSGSWNISPVTWNNPVLAVFNRQGVGKVTIQYGDEITSGFNFSIVRVFDEYTPATFIPLRHEYVTINLMGLPTVYCDIYVYDWLGKEVTTI